MREGLRVLIVEDSMEDTFLIVRELQRGGYNVDFERVETPMEFQTALCMGGWDLVISDYRLPSFDGQAALDLFRVMGLDTPFIVVSGALGEDRAVEMLKAGANDYVLKDRLSWLGHSVKRELTAMREQRNRRQAETDTAYLASLVESCEEAIIGQSLEGTVVSWNSGAERLYGYTVREMIGCSMARLIPHYRPDELTELLSRIRQGEHIDAFDTIFLRKDGTPVEVSLSISPIRNIRGQIIGASSVARNITQRKLDEIERLSLIQELTAALSHTQRES